MMSESEAYYARQNQFAKLAFDANLRAKVDEWVSMTSIHLTSLIRKWEEEHEVTPDVKILEFWQQQRLMAYGCHVRFYLSSTGYMSDCKASFYPREMYETPQKGTDARKAWDATKRRTAARRKKEAMAGNKGVDDAE